MIIYLIYILHDYISYIYIILLYYYPQLFKTHGHHPIPWPRRFYSWDPPRRPWASPKTSPGGLRKNPEAISKGEMRKR